jgi:hypothetical protein
MAASGFDYRDRFILIGRFSRAEREGEESPGRWSAEKRAGEIWFACACVSELVSLTASFADLRQE